MRAARSTGVDGVAEIRQQQFPVITTVLVHDSADARLHSADHSFGAPICPRGVGACLNMEHVVGMQHGREGTGKFAAAIRPNLQWSPVWSQHLREEPLLQGMAGAFLQIAKQHKLGEVIHAHHDVLPSSLGGLQAGG